MAEFYCFKCRVKKEITEGIEYVITRNGRPAGKSTCPDCKKGRVPHWPHRPQHHPGNGHEGIAHRGGPDV